MTKFGQWEMPEELCVGASLDGFRVESGKQTEAGYVWIFSKGNKGFVFPMPYDEFFDLLTSPYKREDIIYKMIKDLNDKYAEAIGIVITREDN